MKGAIFDKAAGCYRSVRTGRVLCACGRGGASEYDGKCFTCRGGISAFEARTKAEKAAR